MIYSVLVHARSFGDDFAHLAPDAAYKAGGGRSARAVPAFREDAQEVSVIKCAALYGIMLALATVMLAQCHSQFRKRLYLVTPTIATRLSLNLLHQLVN